MRELFERHALEETPKSDDPAFIRARWWTVLSNSDLLEAAKKEAERQGFSTFIDNSCDDWEYSKAADYLLDAPPRTAASKTSASACSLAEKSRFM